ncbi:hypothetical protein Q3C01_38495 [Bradyrhizobium sp. UFLA05-109]
MEFEETNARKRRHFDVKWFKRYSVGCLIAVFVFAAIDGYNRPDGDMRVGAILMAAAGWPVVVAIIVGSTIGGMMHGMNQEKAG